MGLQLGLMQHNMARMEAVLMKEAQVEEEVGHKTPMVIGSEDDEDVEVVEYLSVLLKVTER